jgi:hypothetical protein
MKIQGLGFGDMPRGVDLPQQSAQVLSEYSLAGMPDPPKARLLRSVFRTLITFGALESSRSFRQISGGLLFGKQRSVGYHVRITARKGPLTHADEIGQRRSCYWFCYYSA